MRVLVTAVVASLFLTITSAVPGRAAEPAIKHRFLAVGESRPQLIYVDQLDPAKSWDIKLPLKCRDYQLIGRNQLLLNAANGYLVYDLVTHSLVKEVHLPTLTGVMSVRRTSDGRTLAGCNTKDGITIVELGADDKLLRTAHFKDLNNMRLMRLTQAGTLLFGCNSDWVVEADLDGKVLNKFQSQGAKHIYQVLRQPDGNILFSAGYGHFLSECLPNGKEVHRLGGTAGPAGVNYFFWSGFQKLKNGNTVISNWTGHGAQDSTKGHQIVELDAKGELVWSWHDATLAGTIHGVIVLDDLDTSAP